ncbi:MAG: GtrA family protein [Pseudomonadaceae bacterium]|nr:GtrA family protein [Pseudomonadaceae bacterium]
MKQFIIFGFAGAVGFLIDAIAFVALLELLNLHIARICSFFIAVNATYFLNKKLTFKSTNNGYWKYVFGQTQGVAINLTTFEISLYFLSNTPFGVAVAFFIGSLLALAFNFIYAKKVVFNE